MAEQVLDYANSKIYTLAKTQWFSWHFSQQSGLHQFT